MGEIHSDPVGWIYTSALSILSSQSHVMRKLRIRIKKFSKKGSQFLPYIWTTPPSSRNTKCYNQIIAASSLIWQAFSYRSHFSLTAVTKIWALTYKNGSPLKMFVLKRGLIWDWYLVPDTSSDIAIVVGSIWVDTHLLKCSFWRED